jgi:diguanylate cyclase (GGDEF)-like protein
LGQLSYALNAVFGSILVLVIIMVDYCSRSNTDIVQRRIFLGMLFCAVAGMLSEFAWVYFIDGMTVENKPLFMGIASFYYFFTPLCFCSIFLCAYYFIHREKKHLDLVWLIFFVVNGLNLVFILANFFYPLYFSLQAPGNVFFPGKIYFVYLIFCYMPLFVSAVILLMAPPSVKKLHNGFFIALMIILLLLLIRDIRRGFFRDSLIFWPVLCFVFLLIYLFVVRRDSRLDALTGVGNRYSFNEFTDRMARLEGKRGLFPEKYAIIMLDMDHFKRINDTLGHCEGDHALQDMAKILRDNIREGDMATRYGGDEFVVVCKGMDDTAPIVERIQQGIDALNKQHNRPYHLKMSYGAGIYIAGGKVNGGQPIQEFMEGIDALMYRYKSEHSDERRAIHFALVSSGGKV